MQAQQDSYVSSQVKSLNETNYFLNFKFSLVASKWDPHPVDLFDGRLRTWYIEAANSPKDVIILIDSSGSMTGQRRDIAKSVVENILDSLSPNDFVNVLSFEKNVTQIVPCFKDTLVQVSNKLYHILIICFLEFFLHIPYRTENFEFLK